MSPIREGVALSRSDDTFLMRFSGGDGAWDTLNYVSSSDLFLRDCQMIHTLWLDESASPIGDVYVCRDDADFIVLAEGRGHDLLAHARANIRRDATLEDLRARYRLLSIHGPFAWELMGSLVGMEVIGVPYLSMFRLDGGGLGFRAGKTGEYGYDLLVPLETADAFEKRVMEVGAEFGIARVGIDVLDQCRLENWFFNVRREGAAGLTPLELQLQWRTSLAKEFIGSKALAEKRAQKIARRITTMIAPKEIREGDRVSLFGNEVGTVISCGFSETRGDWIALALIDIAWAHSGIDAFRIGEIEARSVTPPVLDNRSLHVNPQTHSFRTRAEVEFPSLVLP